MYLFPRIPTTIDLMRFFSKQSLLYYTKKFTKVYKVFIYFLHTFTGQGLLKAITDLPSIHFLQVVEQKGKTKRQ